MGVPSDPYHEPETLPLCKPPIPVRRGTRILARTRGEKRIRDEDRDHSARHQRHEKGEEVEHQQHTRVGPRKCDQTSMIQVEQHVGYPEKGLHRRHGKVPVVVRPDDRNREREAGQEQAIDDDGHDRWSGNDQNPARYL